MPWPTPRKRSYGRSLALLLSLPVAFATGFLLQGYAVFDLQRSLDDQNNLTTDYILRLQQKDSEIARLKRSSQIDVEAVREAQQTISDLQQQIADQDQQLQFYQAVLAPEARKSGIRLLDLDLEPGLQQQHFNYRLLMIQQKRNDRLMQGSVRLVVKGLKNGKPVELKLSQLGQKKNSLGFRFRYFSELTGQLVLPAGFKPVSVMVSGKVSKPKRSSFQKKYDWPDTSRQLENQEVPEAVQDVSQQ